MFLSDSSGKKNGKQVILHFVSWYPSDENQVEGIFIQRQIELIASNTAYTNIIVRKDVNPVSLFRHLMALMGSLKEGKTGSMKIVFLPENSNLYKIFFWRYRESFQKQILKRLVRKYKPNLVHLHVVYGFATEAVYIKEKWGIPFIVSEHMGPFPFDWIQDKQTYVTKPMQEAAAVISVSNAQAKQIVDFTGVTATVIPNVVNEKIFYYAEKIKAEDTLQIVFAGIYTEKKGVDYLIRVLPSFLQSHPNCKLHLVGDAKPERMLVIKKQIEKAGIKNVVQFHGQLTGSELCTLYQNSDFYVCSSEWESFGLSALEALFTGLPVLSTNCGGVPDFINSENGIIIANDQKEETLLNGLLQMTNQLSSFNRKEIAVAVSKKFSNNSIKEKYFSIYKKVLQTADQS